MDVQADTLSDAATPAEIPPSQRTVDQVIPAQKTNNRRLLVVGLVIVLVSLAIVLFFVFRSFFFKSTDTSSPRPLGSSGSTGANGNMKKTDTFSPELRLNRPRSVGKPQPPPFKSIDVKNP
jgi:hypothetical protein